MLNLKGKTVLVRGIQSGVHMGIMEDRIGAEVELSEVRNIWRWRGANNFTELSAKGVVDEYTRVTAPVDSVIFTDICEIAPCTEEAVKSIKGCKPWQYQK